MADSAWQVASAIFSYVRVVYMAILTRIPDKTLKQESQADAKVTERQQCVYEGPWRRDLSSAENLTLIMSIGKPVTKLWPFLYIQDGRQPPSWIFEIRKLQN